jgi:hypothetical protein
VGTDQADERLEAGAGVPNGFDEVTDQHMASDVPDRLACLRDSRYQVPRV